ncbi:Ig-like domain-containing protein, partial [Clostridium tagluense]
DTTTTSAAVTWDGAIPTYNKNAEGLYTFSGTITLPTGITNPNDVKASVKVNVEALVIPTPIAPVAFTVNKPTTEDNVVNDDGKSSVSVNWIDSATASVDHYEIVAKVGSTPAVTDIVKDQTNIAKAAQIAKFSWTAGEDLYVGVVAVDTNGLKTLCSGTIGNVTVAIDGHASVVATGMTAVVLPKSPASENKVMLTVSTAASDANHKVYYRVVDADPSAMNVGDVITPANWTEVADTSAHETIIANGKFVEIVEVTTSDRKVTRWGKSVATNDNYTAPVAATGMTAVVLPKGTPEVSKVLLTVSTAASDANHKVYY